MWILSVDDSSIVRKMTRGAIELLDYQWAEANDGEEALVFLDKHYQETALILLDWNMPGMDGYTFLVKAKQDANYKNIPIMMVTTESEQQNIIKAIQAGANHYLVKPFTTEELTKRIMECLGGGSSW